MGDTRIGGITFEVAAGDITTQDVDAIVNAANTSLLGGGGVDGAIHRRAGNALLKECMTLGGCKTGAAKITRGYELPARHVIHAVGPVYAPDSAAVPHLLASAYRHSLDVAAEHGLASIAFPAISTGVYGYPMSAAAQIAVGTCVAFARSRETSIRLIRFVLFSPDAYRVYVELLRTFTDT